MALFNFSIQFANMMGLLALLSIIPLIIIYLLRPRPRKVKIPSLMFLFDLEKKKRLNVFRKFLKDPLFLIQLLALAIISLAIAAPFIMATEEAGGGHTVIIIDASASMQAKSTSGGTKFENAVEQANKFISGRNTIILAESVPVIVTKEAPSGSAADALKKLKPKATSVDLAGAILLGKRMLPEGGRVVVLSDFISWSGDDPSIAKKLAEGSGINVEFVTISGRTDNVGIVNGWFETDKDYRIVIQNFNNDARDVRIDVATDNTNVLSSSLNIKGQSNEYFAINNLNPGITKISISPDDALSVDNNAYLIIPESVKRDILYITDSPRSPSYIALGLLPFTTVEKSGTKNIPSMSGKVVIVSSPLPPESVKTLSDYVNNGGNAIMIASPGMQDMDLLPVELGVLSNRTSVNVVQASSLTDGTDIEKTDVKKHFKAQLKSGAVSLVAGGDRSVMLAYWKFGKGTVIYSGFADPQGDNIYDPLNENVWNDFHANPAYPLFWKQALEWLKGSVDVSEYNAKTGMFIKQPAQQNVKTPGGDSFATDLLLLDEVGVYGLPNKDVAVNLYDEKESNLAGGGLAAGSENIPGPKEVSGAQIILKPRYLDIYLIIGAMFLVFLELYYLRWRGEL
ncbi:MAG TPA: BatA and WFA domain-containing protein [Candidatus Methanoperedens sp.]